MIEDDEGRRAAAVARRDVDVEGGRRSADLRMRILLHSPKELDIIGLGSGGGAARNLPAIGAIRTPMRCFAGRGRHPSPIRLVFRARSLNFARPSAPGLCAGGASAARFRRNSPAAAWRKPRCLNRKPNWRSESGEKPQGFRNPRPTEPKHGR